MSQHDVDFADVQGVVRFGYRKMTQAVYLLLRVRDAAAARAWLRSAPIANAMAVSPPPSTALQVAFTAEGLAALGVPQSVIAGFSAEFLAGTTEPSRLRRLGDVGANAPSNWHWGASKERAPHLLLMLFAEPRDGGVATFERRLTGSTASLGVAVPANASVPVSVSQSIDVADAPAGVPTLTMAARATAEIAPAPVSSWIHAFEIVHRLETSDLDGVEPFGFTDGISQPEIDWDQGRAASQAQLEYTNVVSLGEFLLGYRNEYGKFTDRPLLDADARSAGLLSAQDAPDKKDLGRNGTYLVMRQLQQDVRTFWRFVTEQSGGDAARAESLANAFVGRTRAGDPTVPRQSKPIPGVSPDQVEQNQFTFSSDADGIRCPFGAHIRRANPRNADLPRPSSGVARLIAMLGLGTRGFRDDLISSVRFHRILRRGREYGPELSPAEALAPEPANEPERGLHFICLNANISRQFEFLQNAWIMNSKFNGMTGENDPLIGNREPTPGRPVADFNLPVEGGPRRRVSGLPQFVTVRGGAYFFLPSLRALGFFTGMVDA